MVRSNGIPIAEEAKESLSTFFPDLDFDQVTIVVDRLPWYARFATIKPKALTPNRRRIYFRRASDYDPHSVDGLALLGHELTHIEQHPMKLRYLWESFKIICRRGGDPYRDNPFEKEAFAKEARIRRSLSRTETDVNDTGEP